jgi:hypothetical protein
MLDIDYLWMSGPIHCTMVPAVIQSKSDLVRLAFARLGKMVGWRLWSGNPHHACCLIYRLNLIYLRFFEFNYYVQVFLVILIHKERNVTHACTVILLGLRNTNERKRRMVVMRQIQWTLFSRAEKITPKTKLSHISILLHGSTHSRLLTAATGSLSTGSLSYIIRLRFRTN